MDDYAEHRGEDEAGQKYEDMVGHGDRLRGISQLQRLPRLSVLLYLKNESKR